MATKDEVFTYEHKGIKIKFNPVRGLFEASLGPSTRVVAPSLDAMKKKISALLAVKFTPFKRIAVHPDMDLRDVISMGKGTSYNRGRMVFHVTTERGSTYEEPVLIPDSPANRKAIKEYLALKKKNDHLREQLMHETDKARVALPWLLANKYNGGAKP